MVECLSYKEEKLVRFHHWPPGDKMDKLDLHGIKHEDVYKAVIQFIEKNWASGKEIQIITGHSAKMRSIVKEVLNEYELYYSAEELSPKIIVWME